MNTRSTMVPWKCTPGHDQSGRPTSAKTSKKRTEHRNKLRRAIGCGRIKVGKHIHMAIAALVRLWKITQADMLSRRPKIAASNVAECARVGLNTLFIPLSFFWEKLCWKFLLRQSTGNSLVWRKSAFRIEIREKKKSAILTLLRAQILSSFKQPSLIAGCVLLVCVM